MRDEEVGEFTGMRGEVGEVRGGIVGEIMKN